MRILCIDDDSIIAALVQRELGRAGFAVDCVGTGEEGLLAVAATPYDGILLDLSLPDDDGLSVLKGIRKRRIYTPVLILSARNKTAQRVAGLDAGADDYLPKPFDFTELAARLRALSRRPRSLLGTPLTCGNLSYVPAEHTALVGGTPFPLPRREATVLESLLRNTGRPLSKATLEDRLYAYGEEVASNAVEVHIHHLRKRLAEAGAAVRIETRRGTGYLITATAVAARGSSRVGADAC